MSSVQDSVTFTESGSVENNSAKNDQLESMKDSQISTESSKSMDSENKLYLNRQTYTLQPQYSAVNNIVTPKAVTLPSGAVFSNPSCLKSSAFQYVFYLL